MFQNTDFDMENVEIIEQQEEAEPIIILDPEQEELGEEMLPMLQFHMFLYNLSKFTTNPELCYSS